MVSKSVNNTMNTHPTTLRGLTVLVTRPLELSKQLASQIEKLGAQTIIYPAISIEAPEDNARRDQELQQLGRYDIAIFISPSAVSKTFEHLDSLPPALQVAAIGSSTEKTLAQHNIMVAIKPEGHNSEALLGHPLLQAKAISGKSIIVFRGEGGREKLGETLVSRGANIFYAEMYRRALPKNTASLTDDELKSINIITVSSNQGLQNLFDLTTNTDTLREIPLLVPGDRGEQLASSLGFTHIIRAANATDRACIKALQTWAKSGKKRV
jgi:uroporphyrinogen-III synthase